MKKLSLIITILILMGPLAFAGTERITLGWGANTESDLAGYRLYTSSTPGQYTLVGKNPSLTPSNPPASYVKSIAKPAVTMTTDMIGTDGQVIYFVLTAFDTAGNESGKSNEVSYTFADSPPAAPKGFFARLLQIILSWFRGGVHVNS
jgi:hypothetical protein